MQLLSDPVIGASGEPIGIVTYCEDISDRKRAEEALRTSEERYRLLFERNLAGVYRATPEGRLLECNDAFARILGYTSREEVLGQTAWDLFFSRRDRDVCLARLREKGTLTNFEVRMRRKDGTSVWVLENETLLEGLQGEVVGARSSTSATASWPRRGPSSTRITTRSPGSPTGPSSATA